MKRLLLCLGLASCADPAVLDLVLHIEETELDTLTLKVARDPDQGLLVYDCRMPFNQPSEGSCPSEGGSGVWQDSGRLEVLLFGLPDTGLSIDVEGLRAGRSVTATRAVTRLPAAPRERRTLNLSLLGLTRERFRCALQVEPLPIPTESPLDPEQQTSVTVLAQTVDSPIPTIVVAARGRLGLVRRSRVDPGCTLSLSPFGENSAPIDASASWCYLTPGSLVAGAATTGGVGTLIAGQCANGAGIRYKAAFRSGTVAGIRTKTVVRGRRHLSLPVLANVVGDSRRELVFFARNGANNNDPIDLVIWPVVERTDTPTITVALPGVRFDSVIPAPIVLPNANGHDTILVAGGSRSYGVVSDSIWQELGQEPGRQVRAPVAAYDARSQRIDLYSAQVNGVTRRRFTVGRTVETTELAALAPLSVNTELRLALGSVDADGEPELLLGQGGFVHSYPWEGSGDPTRIDLWRGSSAAEQSILLANLDRQKGAEVISFGAESSKIHATDASGRILDGWPLQITGDDGRRHVLLTDLDPVRDPRALRDVELVVLSSAGLLEVITLGPGSYDPTESPWPLPSRDALGRSVYLGPADPQAPSALTGASASP